MSESNAVETLAIPASWEETTFTRDSFGPDDRAGIIAIFTAGTRSIAIEPVRYSYADGQERVTGLNRDIDISRPDPLSEDYTVPRQTAFAVIVSYQPFSRSEENIVCISHDPDDALAISIWLADIGKNDRKLQRAIKRHAGVPVSTSQVMVSDDDALSTLFTNNPTQCVITGKPTQSHSIEIPYRYYKYFDGMITTEVGMPRFPTTVHSIRGQISHNAWVDGDFDAIDFNAQLDRKTAGEYRFPQNTINVAEDMKAQYFTLRTLDDID
ncbi:MAG: hypothetical protein ABEI06_07275 [Halobacteriaceae archaeon]